MTAAAFPGYAGAAQDGRELRQSDPHRQDGGQVNESRKRAMGRKVLKAIDGMAAASDKKVAPSSG